mmetsp:Transcript_15410/g.21545  ORF Transcript_15410/g.21545 Transcript_15410/m.21545 type:complete len:312 (-) Transcript_15410:43-978(-)
MTSSLRLQGVSWTERGRSQSFVTITSTSQGGSPLSRRGWSLIKLKVQKVVVTWPQLHMDHELLHRLLSFVHGRHIVFENKSSLLTPMKQRQPKLYTQGSDDGIHDNGFSLDMHRKHYLFAEVLRCAQALHFAEGPKADAATQAKIVCTFEYALCSEAPHRTDACLVDRVVHGIVEGLIDLVLLCFQDVLLPVQACSHSLQMAHQALVGFLLGRLLQLQFSQLPDERCSRSLPLFGEYDLLDQAIADSTVKAVSVASHASPALVPLSDQAVHFGSKALVELEFIFERAERFQLSQVLWLCTERTLIDGATPC